MNWLEFNNYSVFLPKVFVYRIEQRFNYWVENLGFFLSEKVYDKKSLTRKNLGRKHSISFYFNIRKYFFSFLLLKLFLNYTFLKLPLFQRERFTKNSSLVSSESIYIKNQNKSKSATSAQSVNRGLKNSATNKTQTLTFKNSRVLFFVTTPVQKLFIDKIFSGTRHLSILLDKNLITNRQFFYKMLFGFHKERKNFAYPQIATRNHKPITSFYADWGFGLLFGKTNNFFFKNNYKKLFFINRWIKFFFTKKLKKFFKKFTLVFKFCNKFFFLNSSIIYFQKFYSQILKIFFLSTLNFFGGLFWIKNFFSSAALNQNILAWRKLLFRYSSAGVTSSIPANQKYSNKNTFFTSPAFSQYFCKLFNSQLVDLFRSLNSAQNYFSANTKNRLTLQIFSEKIFNINDPQKIKSRQSLMDKVMLMRFLPINLIILFISSVNKQALRDVFRMGMPTILISSIENKKLFSDYSFPGNSFEFNILYFYMKFLLDLIKNNFKN